MAKQCLEMVEKLRPFVLEQVENVRKENAEQVAQLQATFAREQRRKDELACETVRLQNTEIERLRAQCDHLTQWNMQFGAQSEAQKNSHSERVRHQDAQIARILVLQDAEKRRLNLEMATLDQKIGNLLKMVKRGGGLILQNSKGTLPK